jgi:sugar phosphate isomerase/epimerase
MDDSGRLGFGDLVLCPATIGATATLEDCVAAAVSGGFAGLSVRPRQVLDAQRRMGSLAAVRRLIDDSGLRVADVDALMDWVQDAEYRLPAYLPADLLIPRAVVVDVAAGIGAQSLNVVDISGVERDWTLLADSFASVCGEVATAGLVAHVEFFRGSMVDSMGAAARLVRGAGQPNGGICIDTFHLHRGPDDVAEQLTANGSLVRMLQVNDAAATPWADQWAERQHGRLLPGDGAIDLVGVLRGVRSVDAAAPIGIEVNNDALHALGPTDAGRAAGRAMRTLLARLDVDRAPGSEKSTG